MEALSYPSIPAILKENAVKYKDKTAVSYKKKGAWVSLTFGECYEQILMLARGLKKAGIKHGDRVAIFSENRKGWAISDFAILCAGGVSVPIYATNTSEQAAYVLNHSGAKIVFVSTKIQYEKLRSVRDQLPNVEKVVSFERFMGKEDYPVYTQYQLAEVSCPLTEDDRREVEAEIEAITHKDIVTIIYTSGTTGRPKGVALTQGNLLSNIEYGLKRVPEFMEEHTFLSFLPMSHILERTVGFYLPGILGNHIAFAENVKKVMENMGEIRPTTVVSVPRLFEKIHSGIYDKVGKSSALKQKLFHAAMEVGREYVNKKYVTNEPINSGLAFKHKIFDRLVFKKIRDRFGGRIKFFVSAGAPLDKTINEFMWIIGQPVVVGYGLTETSPVVTVNNLQRTRFDSVGKAIEKTELKLALDGELLIKGPQVMGEYYHNPEATEETFEDGWFKSGDIAKIDEEGFVYIVDRKKELIVTAGGKNIAPQPLENELQLDEYVSQVLVYGDRKPYLVALITPNIERLIDLADEEGIDYSDLEKLVAHDRIKKLYRERLDAFNAKLPPYKTIKYFAMLPREFTIEHGDLTPTLKLKRKVIYNNYKKILDDLYNTKSNGIVFHQTQTNGDDK